MSLILSFTCEWHVDETNLAYDHGMRNKWFFYDLTSKTKEKVRHIVDKKGFKIPKGNQNTDGF
jgi:tRNA(Ile2) C34 agmatinyltransferase TiaS